MNHDFPGAFADQIPGKSPETAVHDIDGSPGSPDMQGTVTGIKMPEKPVKPADMVHVSVGKKQVVDFLENGTPQRIDTPLSAVEQKIINRLPAVDAHINGIILPWNSKHSGFYSHRKAL